MESRGSAKAYLLSLITAPANNAIAIWGAKPHGRPGIMRYNDATKTSKTKLTNRVLLNFMLIPLSGKNN
jgi:hypothetical protein